MCFLLTRVSAVSVPAKAESNGAKERKGVDLKPCETRKVSKEDTKLPSRSMARCSCRVSAGRVSAVRVSAVRVSVVGRSSGR